MAPGVSLKDGMAADTMPPAISFCSKISTSYPALRRNQPQDKPAGPAPTIAALLPSPPRGGVGGGVIVCEPGVGGGVIEVFISAANRLISLI